MNEEVRTLVKYRLERSRESLEEARILLERGHLNTYVNRLYYACFYAASALLLSRGLSSSKHSGVRSLFHQTFTRYGTVPTEFGVIYDKLFDNRQKGDYADLVRFDPDKVGSWYNEAEGFVEVVEEIANKELSSE